MQLPDRKILILGATCLSIIAVLLTYRIVENKKMSQAKLELTAESGENASSKLADSRVLEALQKTTIEGLTSTSSNPFIRVEGDTLSDRFSKNIVAGFAKFQSGYATEDDISNEIINDIDTSVAPKEKFILAQVKVYGQSGQSELRSYANEFAKQYLIAVAPVAKDKLKYKTDIMAMAPIYKDLATRIMQLQVPANLAVSHLKLANAYYMQAESFYLVSGQEKDPVKALVGLSVLKNTAISQQEAFQQITQYIKQSGILFADNEPGKFWGTNPSSTSGGGSQSSGASTSSSTQ